MIAACGAESGPPSACETVGDARVTRATGSSDLSASPDESPGLSVCHWTGARTSVRVSIDEAPKAPVRYFNRLVELWQFHADDPKRAPRLVYGVGDDRHALGGAGAYWLGATGQLIAQRGKRLVIVTLDAPGLSGDRAEHAASDLVRAALQGAGGSEGGGSASARPASVVEVLSPRSGALVRDTSVEIAGTSGRGATVEVDGRLVRARNGIWRTRVALRRGRNRVEVVGRAGERRELRSVDVERGEPASAVAARLVHRSGGRLPDLRTESVEIAQTVLRRLGLRGEVIPFARGRVQPDRWAVCRTRPFEGERVRRGERVMLWAAPMQLDRASGTDCRQSSG